MLELSDTESLHFKIKYSGIDLQFNFYAKRFHAIMFARTKSII